MPDGVAPPAPLAPPARRTVVAGAPALNGDDDDDEDSDDDDVGDGEPGLNDDDDDSDGDFGYAFDEGGAAEEQGGADDEEGGDIQGNVRKKRVAFNWVTCATFSHTVTSNRASFCLRTNNTH